MGVTELVLLAFVGGAILQVFFRVMVVSVAVPTAALALWILFTELLQPTKGGGASMWPIALIFIGAYSAAGALGGALLVTTIFKTDKSK